MAALRTASTRAKAMKLQGWRRSDKGRAVPSDQPDGPVVRIRSSQRSEPSFVTLGFLSCFLLKDFICGVWMPSLLVCFFTPWACKLLMKMMLIIGFGIFFFFFSLMISQSVKIYSKEDFVWTWWKWQSEFSTHYYQHSNWSSVRTSGLSD